MNMSHEVGQEQLSHIFRLLACSDWIVCCTRTHANLGRAISLSLPSGIPHDIYICTPPSMSNMNVQALRVVVIFFAAAGAGKKLLSRQR